MGALVVLLAMGVVQLALTLHMRNTLISCASEGAHVGALADRSPEDGAQRADHLAEAAFGGRDVEASAHMVRHNGVAVVAVTLSTSVPLMGLWPVGTVEVTAHAIEENANA